MVRKKFFRHFRGSSVAIWPKIEEIKKAVQNPGDAKQLATALKALAEALQEMDDRLKKVEQKTEKRLSF